MLKYKCLILIFALTILSNCSSTTRHLLKHSDGFSIQSEPVKIKYKIQKGEKIEGKFALTKWFWIFKYPPTINIADNIYALDSEGKSQSVFDNTGVITTISPTPIFLSLLKPLYDWFKNDNFINAAKAAAVYNACEKENYNIILTPIYDCKITNFLFYKRIRVNVKGVGAHISEILIDE